MQKIVPHIWFDKEAEQAVQFYSSAFQDCRILSQTRYGKEGFEIHRMPEGAVMTVSFKLLGYEFMCINAGPMFKLNPSISFMVMCRSEEEVNRLWEPLSEGGTALMPLAAYPFSKRYGWVQDRFGVSWQLMYAEGREDGARIVPNFLFTQDVLGKAEEAVDFYASVFKNSNVVHKERYAPGEQPGRDGLLKYSVFTLEGQEFSAMDSGVDNDFKFNEAVSLMVNCDTQEEIDYYWERMSADPKAEQCGWLKDKYGVSWQISPTVLGKMMTDPDKQKVGRVTDAFMKMKKFDMAELEKAYQGK
jgi:predicted 3-demethylubiquinone-9 3-methyltransferase (glyoxalase superfamily)